MEFNEKEKTSAVKQQALQALHDENRRLGLYDGVYAIDVLEQENHLLRARNERLEKELAKQEQANFCERCGKRLGKNDWDIHTCTPPQPKQEQDEPVAYIRVSKTGNVMACAKSKDFFALPNGTLLYTTPQQRKPLTDGEREKLRDAFAQTLTSVYVCGRVWSAWQYGTMSEGDFHPAGECEDVLDELIEAAHDIKE